MQQTLRNLIADGKTAKVIAELRRLTASDADLHSEVNLLAARFSKYEKQHLGNLEAANVLDIELNRINNALLAVIDKLNNDDARSGNFESSLNGGNASKKGCVISISIAIAFAFLIIANWTAFSKLLFNKIEPVSTEVLVIKGVVKDSEGSVLPQVKIAAEGASVISDDNGYFELRIKAHDDQTNYRINISKIGFETKNETYIPDSQIPEYRLKKK